MEIETESGRVTPPTVRGNARHVARDEERGGVDVPAAIRHIRNIRENLEHAAAQNMTFERIEACRRFCDQALQALGRK
jgi:hypothetical protein